MAYRRSCWLIVVAVGMAVTLSAQTPRPTFEVASVRKTVQPNPIAPAPTAPDTSTERARYYPTSSGSPTAFRAFS
jgi:hypothetical protein